MSELFCALAMGLPLVILGSLLVTWFAVKIGYVRFEEKEEDDE